MGKGYWIFYFIPNLDHIFLSKANPHQVHPIPFPIQICLSFYQISQDFLQSHLKSPAFFMTLKTHPLKNQIRCLSSSGIGTVFRTPPKAGTRNVLINGLIELLMESVALG